MGPQGTGRLARVWFWYAGRPADIPAPSFFVRTLMWLPVRCVRASRSGRVSCLPGGVWCRGVGWLSVWGVCELDSGCEHLVLTQPL